MKKLVWIIVVLALFSCSGNQNQAENTAIAFALDNLMAVAEQEVDKTITVVGYVTHTCKHSGKRCFIVGESQNVSLMVEAEGEIKEFTPELVGSKLAITGIFKEHQLSEASIDEQENNVKQLQQQEEMVEACAAELTNIATMRQWMKEHGKNYYSIYYMDGMTYEVLD